MHGDLCRWQLEDEQAVAGVDVGEPEHVTEECPVSLRVDHRVVVTVLLP
jgi:hypothetical protein